jgi:phage protein U
MEQIDMNIYTLPGRQLSTEEQEALPGYLERLETLMPVRPGADVREVLVYSNRDGAVMGCYVIDMKEAERAKVQNKGFVPGLRFVKKEQLLH